jgi:hypothetical protein
MNQQRHRAPRVPAPRGAGVAFTFRQPPLSDNGEFRILMIAFGRGKCAPVAFGGIRGGARRG